MNNTQCYAANESENWKGKGFILTVVHIDVSCEQESCRSEKSQIILTESQQ